MRDRYRTAFGDLLFETRHDRAVASENVAEAYCNKFGFCVFCNLRYIAHTAVLIIAVNMKRKQFIRFFVADFAVKRLYYHLAQAF